MLDALSFVPLDHILEIFEKLCDNDVLAAEAHEIVDYFEDS